MRFSLEVRLMKNLRSSLKASGYDSEEAYFYARERELIQKMREANGRPKLEVLQGGKVDAPKTQGIQAKKAA